MLISFVYRVFFKPRSDYFTYLDLDFESDMHLNNSHLLIIFTVVVTVTAMTWSRKNDMFCKIKFVSNCEKDLDSRWISNEKK